MYDFCCSACCRLSGTAQEATDENDYIRACSKTADGNVVLAGHTYGDWNATLSGDSAIIAVKLDVTDGAVIWRYQVYIVAL